MTVLEMRFAFWRKHYRKECDFIMWLLYAVGSSFFAGITSILAKCGIKKTDSDVATAIRTIVVLLFSWLMVLITGTSGQITQISGKTFSFLVLSGLATGASWLCYFHALQKGDINKVVPIDKSSTVLTILLALIFLHEGITVPKIISVVLIGVGTLLMIDKKQDSKAQTAGKEWMIYAVLSAVFASLTAILGKVGIEGVDSNLGTAIRTTVVLVMAWLMVVVKGKWKQVKTVEKKELAFVMLSGLATGASWLCYYRALQTGQASVVVPIDKLSILVTIAFSWIVFREKLSGKAVFGLSGNTVAGIIVGGFRRSFRINMSDPIASLTRREWWVWICSLVVIVMANILPGDFDLLTLIASCIGVTSLVLAAKGNVWSQILMIIFSILYGIISWQFRYWGK